ncbi:MAG: hypothetical protein QOG54_747 [Actinomycetota bacterium]|jgi:hypothetical protein|nr:hypothetical protein [Actinomycetota bacterium]
MREDEVVKRFVAVLALIVLAISGFVAFRTVDTCHDYQDRYKKFVYSEMMKNSPIIIDPDELFGEPPWLCEKPSGMLTADDRARYNREGIGPNEFTDEMREAARRRS